MKTAKFGGSSLATYEMVRMVCEIIAADPERRIIVVSAPGKRHDGDTKVTDLLIACAEKRLASEDASAKLAEVVERYAQIAEGFGLDESVMAAISADLSERVCADTCDRAYFMENMKAGGEDNSARLVAAALTSLGHPAVYVSPREAGLRLSAEAGNARVLPESYDNLAELAEMDQIVVFPGFFGYTPPPDERVVTLPRGGSDITGSILARATGSELYENFTDVDAVSVVDPKIVPGACPITRLTYPEMRELAYTGFSVFNDEALAPVAEVGIPVRIKNTGNPEAQGTWIGPSRESQPGEVVGITSRDGFAMIFVRKYGMNREVGFGRRLLRILEKEKLAYEHTPTGIDDISVVLRERGFDQETENRVLARIMTKLSPDEVRVDRGYALVMVVGQGLRDTPGLAGRATTALAKAGVNIEMMNQGGSELSMVFGVRSHARLVAVRALYDAFFEGREVCDA